MFKKINALVLAIAVAFSVNFMTANVARAQLVDFGGFVVAVVQCTCSAGVWIMVVNPDTPSLTGPYLWSFGNPPRNDDITLNYPFIGMSLLGKTINNGEQCQMTIGTGCVNLFTRATLDGATTGKGVQPLGS